MLELLGVAWVAFCFTAIIRIILVGRIQWRAIDITRDIVDTGILNGAISSAADINLLYDNLEKRGFYANVFDLTRWTMRGFYPELARWEVVHGL